MNKHRIQQGKRSTGQALHRAGIAELRARIRESTMKHVEFRVGDRDVRAERAYAKRCRERVADMKHYEGKLLLVEAHIIRIRG